MSKLQVESIRGGYATADEIVKGIDLTVEGHDLAVIIGPNGAGKSTFLKLVAGLLKPKEGQVAIDGHALKLGDPFARPGFAKKKSTIFLMMIFPTATTSPPMTFVLSQRSCIRVTTSGGRPRSSSALAAAAKLSAC